MTGNASTITQLDGERRFLASVGSLERMLTKILMEKSKYFKRDEETEAAVAEAMRKHVTRSCPRF